MAVLLGLSLDVIRVLKADWSGLAHALDVRDALLPAFTARPWLWMGSRHRSCLTAWGLSVQRVSLLRVCLVEHADVCLRLEGADTLQSCLSETRRRKEDKDYAAGRHLHLQWRMLGHCNCIIDPNY